MEPLPARNQRLLYYIRVDLIRRKKHWNCRSDAPPKQQNFIAADANIFVAVVRALLCPPTQSTIFIRWNLTYNPFCFNSFFFFTLSLLFRC